MINNTTEVIKNASEQNDVNNTYADRSLCTALDIGENMLRCGGEIHRVEDSIERICKAYGACHVEVFSIPSLIVTAIRMPDGSYSSQIRRIYDIANDLARLEALNEISREICRCVLPHEEVQKRIREIKRKAVYPQWMVFIGAFMASGGFAVFFGGTVVDGVCAAVIGIIITMLDSFDKFSINKMARNLLISFAAGTLAMTMYKVGLPINTDKVIIGDIMLLVSGIAFGNSLRDMLCGDIISGIIGLIRCLLSAAMTAGGFTVAMVIFGGVG